MIARGLRPNDVVTWPGDEHWWWVKRVYPVDPQRCVDGLWRVAAEQLTGLGPGDPIIIAAADVDPDMDFPLVEGEP